MKMKFIPVLALFLIIVLPVIVILYLKTGKTVYKTLPYIGNKYEKAPGDTVYYTIPDFTLTNQYGQPAGSTELKGKIYVADFFFTSCLSICPKITKNLKAIYDEYKDDSDFKIISISVDPEHDNVQKLADYAKEFDIKGDKWYFLTGKKDYIYDLISDKGFLIMRPQNALAHSEKIDLIDQHGHIRGQYDGTNEADMEKLKNEIHLLQVVEAKQKAEKNKKQ